MMQQSREARQPTAIDDSKSLRKPEERVVSDQQKKELDERAAAFNRQK